MKSIEIKSGNDITVNVSEITEDDVTTISRKYRQLGREIERANL